jgi:hypothetical protein
VIQKDYHPQDSSDPPSLYTEKEVLKESDPSTTSTTPLVSEGSSESIGDRPIRGEGDFSQFLAAYPFRTTMSFGEAQEAFADLSIKDRLKAIRFAKIYAADLKTANRTHVIDAAKWLKGRKFDEAERVVAAKGQAAAAVGAPVFVAMETDAWSRWVRFYRETKHREPPTSEHGGRSGWWFPSLFPPMLGANVAPVERAPSSTEAFDRVARAEQ